MKVMTIDVGGSHVKALCSGTRIEKVRFDSGPKLTPAQLVSQLKPLTEGWPHEAISIGYPGPVVRGKIAAEPKHLGRGWVGFNFERALGHPVRIINDAAMQALGSFTRGKLLFLGLGTGLGSAMVVDGRVEPMELAHLPYRKGKSFEDYVGARGFKKLGVEKWRKHVWTVVDILRAALLPESVVIGGGNAKLLGRPRVGVKLVHNSNAFVGGFRLWDSEAYGAATAAQSNASQPGVPLES